jgi:prophage regulatory protein
MNEITGHSTSIHDGQRRPRRFLRLASVVEVTGLPQSSVYELASQGRFPKQVRISDRAVAWIEDEILDWIDARIAERNGGA